MAGSSLSPGSLRSRETSPNPSLVVTPARLTPRVLPPIVLEGRSSARQRRRPRPPPSSPAPWSWYHRNCTHTKPQQRPVSQHPVKSSKTPKKDEERDIMTFLDDNPDFLADYVFFEISAYVLEDWLQRKRRIDGTSPETMSPDARSNCSYQFARCSNYKKTLPSPSDENGIELQDLNRTAGPSDNKNGYYRQPDSRYKDTVQEYHGRNGMNMSKCRTVTLPREGVHRSPRMLPVTPDVRPSGASKPRRLLPNCCGARRQLYLTKTVPLTEAELDVMSSLMKLTREFFPDSSTDKYFIDNTDDVYHLTSDTREYCPAALSRFIRSIAPVWGPRFVTKADLPYLPETPRQVIDNFNKNKFLAYLPIYMNIGVLLVEMWNLKRYRPQDKVAISAISELITTSIDYQNRYYSLLNETQMSAFLLQVAEAVFEEMLSLDQLIKKILEVAQHLVSADRASLFLVDYRNFELVSTVFDLQYESNQDTDMSKNEIRFPISKGIAGHVAMSGETMNIPDAYSDDRFNKAVDEATGYRTVSILCMPIKVRGKVIAVVQMVNKRDKKVFNADDEAAFQVFATFFGLALHNAKLYDKIKRKEQKYKVALEVLGYHNTCTEEDVATIIREREKEEEINYNDFALNPFEVDDIGKCKGILTMFEDLFDIRKFDVTVLTRFVLTVKKNYRKVPYHNFDHGWSVANAMYVMLKHDADNRFDYKNRLALFVASLCHDLDHRGYTNKFMSDIESPLAAMYTTSTLEHHHFNMTVTILQQDGHNIFYQISGEDYKEILDSIRHCILATDLATLFPNLKKINELVSETPQFNWNDVNHRDLSRSFCMTCADLCAAAKPFAVQMETVDIITAEFYQQGDLERQAGRTPISMMDRTRPEELPASQVGLG